MGLARAAQGEGGGEGVSHTRHRCARSLRHFRDQGESIGDCGEDFPEMHQFAVQPGVADAALQSLGHASAKQCCGVSIFKMLIII